MRIASRAFRGLTVVALLLAGTFALPVPAADVATIEIYNQLKTFKLSGMSVHVENLDLKRDRLQMNFTGDFYFAEPVNGGVYGAVFIGRGSLHSEPVSVYEKASVRRFLKQDTVDSTFTKAVLRFTDDTYDRLSARATVATVPTEAQLLATNLEKHLIRESGVNVSSRVLLAILNRDNPGFFYTEVDGGTRGRFSALVDHQARTLGAAFDVNGGEKGLIFKYEGIDYGNDVWTAFFDEQDFQRGTASYSDAFDLVSIPLYQMDVDLRDPFGGLSVAARLRLVAQADNVQVLPMRLNEDLVEYDNERKNKGLKIVSAELADGTPVGVIQEEWETGFSLLLPKPLARGQSQDVNIKFAGKGSLWTYGAMYHYPLSTTSWYPRHGYLARSRFEVTFHHKKDYRVASIGERAEEGPVRPNSDEWTTKWVVSDPVALIAFVMGRFERHEEKTDVLGQQLPVEFYSPPGDVQAIKEDFILAEIGNAVRFFSTFFGKYPYSRIGGAFFPTNFGQGFPTLLLLPVRGTATRDEFAFMAHETAHQWWGNLVGWRSYRDQWLSEGFAEYSGVLYTRRRTNASDADELVKEMRRDMLVISKTDTGASKLRLHEVGPLILGHRLFSSRSTNSTALMYSKGALVLRMLHFLLSNPEMATDAGFYDMMKDFVERHRNGLATTESFMQVAGEHFARSPIGLKYGLKNLDWFLSQWIYATGLPTYQLDYRVEPREGGGVLLKGTLIQQGVDTNWFMPIPLVFEFSGKRLARTSIAAKGPKSEIEIRLPEKPQKVRLDPDLWILTEKTSEKGS